MKPRKSSLDLAVTAEATSGDGAADLTDIPETDFRHAQRNPYLVLLAPDVRALFPSAAAVNQALRDYARERGLLAARAR